MGTVRTDETPDKAPHQTRGSSRSFRPMTAGRPRFGSRVFTLRRIIDADSERRGLQWQVGVWDRISQLYVREMDRRFATVVENVLTRGVSSRVTESSTLAPGRAPLRFGRRALSGVPAA